MNIKRAKLYLKNTLLPVAGAGLLTGIFSGVVVFFFRLGAEYIAELVKNIYAGVAADLRFLPLLLLGLAAIGVIAVLVQKAEPLSSGDGTSTANGILRGILTFRWLRVLITGIFNSYLTFFAGLPLGSEGPSVLVGTSIGAGTGALFKKSHAGLYRYTQTAGAAGGFAAALFAPLTGLMFAIEGVHKKFSSLILLSAATGILSAVGVSAGLSYLMFGNATRLYLFAPVTAAVLPLKYIYLPLIIGIIAAVIGVAFLLALKYVSKAFVKLNKKVPQLVVVPLVLVLIGLVGVFVPSSVGTGHHFLVDILSNGIALPLLFVALALRLVTITASNSAKVMGGMFIPVVVLGGIFGGIVGKIAIYAGMDEGYIAALVIIAIAAFMTAVMRTPVTAVVFAAEALGGVFNAGYILLAVLVAYALTELVSATPLYKMRLSETIAAKVDRPKPHYVKYSMVVEPGAFAVGKTISSIIWPPFLNAMVVESESYSHDGSNRDIVGNRLMAEGDRLTVRVLSYDEEKTVADLEMILGKQTGDIIHKG